jgi:hypothetical protein
MLSTRNGLRGATLAASIFILSAVVVFTGCTPEALTEDARAEGEIPVSGTDLPVEDFVEDTEVFKRVMTPYAKVEGIEPAFSAPETSLVTPDVLKSVMGEPELTEDKKETIYEKEYDVTYHYYEDKMYVEVDGKIVQVMYLFADDNPYKELNEFLTFFDIVPGSDIRYINDDNQAIMQCVDVNDKVYQILISINYFTSGAPENAIITYDRDYEIVSPFGRKSG